MIGSRFGKRVLSVPIVLGVGTAEATTAVELRDADDGRVASAGLATHRRASAAHVARAAVEGVACSVLDAVDALQTAQALRGDGSC